MELILREYQQDTIEANRRLFDLGYYATLSVLATGLGKTAIFVEYVEKYLDLTKQRALIITPAHLVHQTYNEFMLFYRSKFSQKVLVNNELVESLSREIADEINPQSRVIIASSMTLVEKSPEDFSELTSEDFDTTPYGGVELSARSMKSYLVSPRVDAILKYGLPDYIIYDEAHHSVSDRMLLLIRDKLWKICDILGKDRIRLMGFTATGYREDGIDLGNLYQSIAIQRGVRWAQEHGYLAPLREIINIHAVVDMEQNSVSRVINWKDVLLTAWKERGENRQTIGYMGSVEDSEAIARFFNENGVPSAHLDSNKCVLPTGVATDVSGRYAIYDQFISGKIKCIFNYSVILEGTNLPPASCMLWARSTENVQLATQAIGRMLRLFSGNEFLPNKDDVIILNAVGKDFIIMSSGILGGLKIDPLTGIVEQTELDEEVEVSVDEKDLRDLDGDKVFSDGVVYSAGKLIRKSGSAWYTDERTNVRTLPITLLDTLVIIPPYYTLANKLQYTLDSVELDDNTEEILYYAATFFSNYTLWHHVKDRRTDTFVYANESFERLLDYSVLLTYEITDSPINAFMKRKSRKNGDPASNKSIYLMNQLSQKYHVPVDHIELTKWDVSDMITFILAFRADVYFSVKKIYESIKEYL